MNNKKTPKALQPYIYIYRKWKEKQRRIPSYNRILVEKIAEKIRH